MKLPLRFKAESHTEPEVIIDYNQVEAIVLDAANHKDGSPGVRLRFRMRSGEYYQALPAIKTPDGQFIHELETYVHQAPAGSAVYEEFLAGREARVLAVQ